MGNPGTHSSLLFIREGRLHPIWRATFYTLAYLSFVSTAQIPIALAWVAITIMQGKSLEKAVESIQTDFLSLAWFLPLALLQALVVIGTTYLFRYFLDRKSFFSLGLRTTPGWVADGLLGLFLGFIMMGLIFAFQGILGWANIQFASGSIPRLILQLIGYGVAYIAVGIAEELMFRGYLLQTLQEWPGSAAAVIITSTLFGVFHACNPSVTPLALVHLVVAGFVFAYTFLITGRLWLPIALHFSWNFFQGPVFGFPVSGVPPQGLFIVEPTGPEWITGGAFGPEAGLTGLIALGCIALITWGWSHIMKSQETNHELPADN